MKRLAWMTDIHLNFLRGDGWEAFITHVRSHAPDALLITGDIAESPSVEMYLLRLRRQLDVPVYFVLGNHDFYRGSIATVRRTMEALTRREKDVAWMPAAGVVPISPGTALVGHDGWADGRLGDYAGSDVLLNDYILIEELSGLDRRGRLARLHALGDEAAGCARKWVAQALEQFEHVVFLTHVPPFRDACWYEGKISAEDWLPHFSCKAVGDVLVDLMRAHPDRRMTVLCGHTHGEGTAEILPNLRVLTGAAQYGAPRVQEVLSIA